MTIVFNNFWVEFSPAISSLLKWDLVEFADNSIVLFPSQAKCEISEIGPSGTIQTLSSICLVPQNVINLKIFIFLYLWLLALLLFTTIHIIILAVKFCSQCNKGEPFGHGLVLAFIKRNLRPVLFDILLDGMKENVFLE